MIADTARAPLSQRVAGNLPHATLCVIVRNEERGLLEWVAYHRAIGFDRILIYDNDSSDGTGTLCRALDRAGLVSHRPWPDPPADANIGPQVPAYEHAARELAARDRVEGEVAPDWLCFLDADEFLVLEHADTVGEFLGLAGRARMPVALNWRIFGSSGHVQAAAGLVIDRFVRCARATEDVNRHVKTIGPVDMVRAGARVHVHGWILPEGAHTVDATGVPVMVRGYTFTDVPLWRGAWINHYIVKSREDFETKRLRGKATHAVSAVDKYDRDVARYFTSYDRNEEEDRTIHRFRDRLLAELDRLDRVVLPRPDRLDKALTFSDTAVLLQPDPGWAPPAVEPTTTRDESEPEDKAMIVLPSYGSLVGANGRPTAFVEVVKNHLHDLLRSIVDIIEVDENWYVGNYGDVADAVAEGRIRCGADHYRMSGYFEDRMPRRIEVDEAWYLASYPDVREAIADRAVQTAQQHFERDGFREGRAPSKGWALWKLEQNRA